MDPFDLSVNTAIVAGGSRAIGLAIAAGPASAGAAVVVPNSVPQQGEPTAAAIRAGGGEGAAGFTTGQTYFVNGGSSPI
jgi:NAD(P)-dependent dehydrogenase (short-subunit alcohol dehydrogenase family)